MVVVERPPLDRSGNTILREVGFGKKKFDSRRKKLKPGHASIFLFSSMERSFYKVLLKNCLQTAVGEFLAGMGLEAFKKTKKFERWRLFHALVLLEITD